MFNSNKKSGSNINKTAKNDAGLASVNMVSEGTEIIGTLRTESDIRIAGSIDGEAKVNGKIIIASTGHINGNIEAEDADIAGRVEGEVHANGKLCLRQSSVVEGDLHAQSLVVEEGATFNGTCHMHDYASENKQAVEQEKTKSSKKDDTVAA